MKRMPCMISTEVNHCPDGSRTHEWMITARTLGEVVAIYRMLAEIDAMAAVGDVLERIGAIESE